MINGSPLTETLMATGVFVPRKPSLDTSIFTRKASPVGSVVPAGEP